MRPERIHQRHSGSLGTLLLAVIATSPAIADTTNALRFSLAPQSGIDYAYRESARVTYSDGEQAADPLEFSNNGSLVLRAAGGDGSVLNLTLLGPQVDEATLLLDTDGTAVTLNSVDELLPGISKRQVTAEPRYSADWLRDDGPRC
jgi:hypothetical protein